MAAQENTSHLDIIDMLGEKTAILAAMLAMTKGSAFETFNAKSDSIRDRYMQGCCNLSDEIGELVKAAHQAHLRETGGMRHEIAATEGESA